jgi:hypothetical protein
MTIARIVAITAVVCAAMGMATQAEAKRIPKGHILICGIAYWVPLSCIVMGSGTSTYVLNRPVPLNTPIMVLARKTGNVGFCYGTHVDVVTVVPIPKGGCIWR